MSSRMTFCDEKDGPNVDSNASAEGNCGPVAVLLVLLRGDSGSFVGGRGLLASDDEDCIIAWEEEDGVKDPLAAAEELLFVESDHSFDLAVLMPLRR